MYLLKNAVRMGVTGQHSHHHRDGEPLTKHKSETTPGGCRSGGRRSVTRAHSPWDTTQVVLTNCRNKKSWAVGRSFTGTATRCWREWGQCGQTSPKNSKRSSPSQSTKALHRQDVPARIRPRWCCEVCSSLAGKALLPAVRTCLPKTCALGWE